MKSFVRINDIQFPLKNIVGCEMYKSVVWKTKYVVEVKYIGSQPPYFLNFIFAFPLNHSFFNIAKARAHFDSEEKAKKVYSKIQNMMADINTEIEIIESDSFY